MNRKARISQLNSELPKMFFPDLRIFNCYFSYRISVFATFIEKSLSLKLKLEVKNLYFLIKMLEILLCASMNVFLIRD